MTQSTSIYGGQKNEHRSEEHTSELQSQSNLVCRLLLEKTIRTRRVIKPSGSGTRALFPPEPTAHRDRAEAAGAPPWPARIPARAAVPPGHPCGSEPIPA